jgi:predicted enzyme related to lactoylglutathione lyase
VSGRVTHFEIPADDVERAQAFYREAFGWRIQPVPEMNYTLISTTDTDENGFPKEPGAINGGLMTRGGTFTAPVITIEADDIDDTLLTVEKLGGAVAAPKMAVGDMGFAAYFTDPEGNVIGLWQSARK